MNKKILFSTVALMSIGLIAGVIIGFKSIQKASPVIADVDPISSKIEVLNKQLNDAIADAQKNGEFTTDVYGQRVYAGETAKKMEALHKAISIEERELQARPAADRAISIKAIDQWNDKFLYSSSDQSRQHLNYAGKLGGVDGLKKNNTELYYSEDYAFQIDISSNKVLNLYIRPKEVGEPQEKLDLTARFNASQLEKKAREFVADQNLGVNLDSLKLEIGQKDSRFFYVWTSEDGKTLQVGFTQSGQLINYTNKGFFDNI